MTQDQIPTTCCKCRRLLTLHAGNVFMAPASASGAVTKCRSCALIHIPMLKKSALTALVVGTILTGLNQGDMILLGILTTSLIWKIPLTFAVPFCVATFSALANTRR